MLDEKIQQLVIEYKTLQEKEKAYELAEAIYNSQFSEKLKIIKANINKIDKVALAELGLTITDTEDLSQLKSNLLEISDKIYQEGKRRLDNANTGD